MRTVILSVVIALIGVACSNATKNEIKQTKDPIAVENQIPAQQTPAENPYKDAKVDIRIFSNDTIKQEPKLTGYGYDILIYDAVYNHQPHIPAINGVRGFHTLEQAQKTAELVVFKIKNNVMPPSLSVKELDSLDVLK